MPTLLETLTALEDALAQIVAARPDAMLELLEQVRGQSRDLAAIGLQQGEPLAVAKALRLATLTGAFKDRWASERGRAAARIRRATKILEGEAAIQSGIMPLETKLEQAKLLALRGGLLDEVHADRSARGMAAAHCCFLRGASIFSELGLGEDAARQMAQAAGSSFRLGRLQDASWYERAHTEYGDALRLGAACSPGELAAWEVFRASAFGELVEQVAPGRFEEGRKAFEAALVTVDAHGNPKTRALARLNFGALLLASRGVRWREDAFQALALLEAAIALADDDASLVASIRMTLCHAWLTNPGGALTSNVERAIGEGEAAFDWLASSGMAMEAARVAQNLGEAYAMRVLGDRSANLGNARAFVRFALRQARRAGNRAMRRRFLFSAARIEMFHGSAGEPAKLRRAARAIRAVISDAGDARPGSTAIEALALSNILQELHRTEADPQLIEEARRIAAFSAASFRVSEERDSLRRALMAAGSVDAREGEWAQASNCFEEALTLLTPIGADVQRDELADRARSFGSAADLFGRAAYARLRQNDPEGALRRILAGRGRTLRALLGQLPLALDAALTPPLAASLYVVPVVDTEGGALLLAYFDDGGMRVEALELEVLNHAEVTVRIFGDGADRPGLAPMLESDDPAVIAGLLGPTIDWLDERVAAPLGAWVRQREGAQWRELVMIPHASTSILPWRAAFEREPALGGLALKVAIGIEPGRAPAVPLSGARLVLVPDPGGDLEGASIECDAIARLYPSGRSKILPEAEATPDGFLAAAGEADLLHFSGHSRHDPYDARMAALILANGGLLRTDRIAAEARMTAGSLVVLASCEAGASDFAERGDEATGLATAWLAAGASGVVAPLWMVSDLATTIVMIRYYRHILSGAAPGEALSRASAELRELSLVEAQLTADALELSARDLSRAAAISGNIDRPFAHPYFWSGFCFFSCEGVKLGRPAWAKRSEPKLRAAGWSKGRPLRALAVVPHRRHLHRSQWSRCSRGRAAFAGSEDPRRLRAARWRRCAGACAVSRAA